MGDVSPAVIKKTQDTLGKYVKRPQLSDKLLKKPPFRFLHDVINVVIQDTGFLNGLYTIDELNYENIKDKDAKIDFLQKVIDAVKLTTNENLKVRPSKIVAGHEPDKTNELLQAIGRALDKKLSSNRAVEAVKNGKITSTKSSNKPSAPTSTNTTDLKKKPIGKTSGNKHSKSIEDKVKPPSNERIAANAKKPIRSRDNKGKPDENVNRGKKTEVNKEPVESKLEIAKDITPKPEPIEDPVKLIEQPVIIEPKANSDTNDTISKLDELQSQESRVENKIIEPQQIEIDLAINDENKSSIPTSHIAELVDVIDQEAELRRKERSEERHKETRKTSAQKNTNTVSKEIHEDQHILVSSASYRTAEVAKKKNNGDETSQLDDILTAQPNPVEKSTVVRPRTSLRPPSVRPASARPGAPRRRDRNVEIILHPEESLNMNGVSIKVDTLTTDLDDEGENLIIIEDPMEAQTNLSNGIAKSTGPSSNEDQLTIENSQGHLVQQILETQKEFSKNDVEITGTDLDGKTDIEWDSATARHRQSSAKQMETLRDSIQKLTRSVNPLGKLMDFLQEDIDSMQMELLMWRNIYTTTKEDFKRETGLTQTAILPLKQQLLEIEESIKEHIELTNTSRINILQSQEKIYQLLSEI